jgi:hypothetical protein
MTQNAQKIVVFQLMALHFKNWLFQRKSHQRLGNQRVYRVLRVFNRIRSVSFVSIIKNQGKIAEMPI